MIAISRLGRSTIHSSVFEKSIKGTLKKLPFSCTNFVEQCKIDLNRIRPFHSEAQYHAVADETLESIQDSLDDLFELKGNDEEVEVSLSSGVLTIAMPPHGTWVLNKQTPNRQLWWSSPLSGPRRYEYDEDQGLWYFTRSDNVESLGEALKEEIHHIYQVDLQLDDVQ